MEADGALVPQSLSAKFEGSFAYLTVRDRLPTILTKVIDTIHRNKDTFLRTYGEEGVRAEKSAISFLSKLRNELQTDKPVLALADHADDTHAWNDYMRRQQELMEDGQLVSWFKSPWLYVECYMYRRIQEALLLNPPMDEFDVYKEGKTQSFFESQQAIKSLCTHLQQLLSEPENTSESRLKENFLTLLQVSLWGNKCDLSISSGRENPQSSSPVQSLPDLRRFILVDHSEQVWSSLTASSAHTVDFVLDNAGFELLSDLVLADFLVWTGLAKRIRFHGKSFPWFVSDVTKRDFDWTVAQTAAFNHKWASACGARWRQHVKGGVWSYHDHAFWTLPHEFCDMPRDAADLYASLLTSDLLVLKGDLNYRKLTGDRLWRPVTELSRALRGFLPAPLCCLRTLKAEVQVGLQEGQAERLSSLDPAWMTSGKYAVVQFTSPR